MINWNDIEVEQKIAQERYREIIRARQAARSQPARTKQKINFGALIANLVDKLALPVNRSPQSCPE